MRPHNVRFGRKDMRTFILNSKKNRRFTVHYGLFYTRRRTARRDVVVVSNEEQVDVWCMELFISHNYVGPYLESALLCVAVAVGRFAS